METFTPRQLLSMTSADIWANIPEVHAIAFDDGVTLESTNKKTLYSSAFWDIIRSYPNTPLKSTHHVSHVLKGKPLTSSTHIDLLTIIKADVEEAYHLDLPEQKEHLLEMIYKVTNNIHNNITQLAEAHVTSIDILDFIEVVEHPIVKAANNNVQNTDESITETYKIVNDTIVNDLSLRNNGLTKAVRSKMVNANQVSQCVSVLGRRTEVDGSIMRTPVNTGFTKGMWRLYDLIAESRSAAKSLYFSEAPLQDAEYFARRLQLLAMCVEKIHYSDCGSQKYIQWRITPPQIDEKGRTTYPGDLKFMAGKFYLNESTGKLQEIKGDEQNLNGQVLKIRSVLHCQHSDPHAVCSVCFGGLSRNVSRFANLGHLCAATMTQQTSQSVLSTKHLDASSVSANIVLTELMAKYLTTNRGKNAYLIKKELKDKEVRITVNREEAVGLTDILNIDDVDNINPMRVSSIECIEITHKTKGGEEESSTVFVNQGNRQAILTSEFLRYLKVHRWKTDGKNNFVFDLFDWDFNQPIMKLPDMEYSFSDHSHQIAKLIESSMKNITDRSNPHSPVSTLQELFGLVNTKLNVNIAALEVIIYSTMLPNRGSYGMARGAPHPVLGIAGLVIKNRSLGPALAYEDQAQTLTNPMSFFKLDRPSSIFDVFIAPNAVVAEEKRKEARALAQQ